MADDVNADIDAEIERGDKGVVPEKSKKNDYVPTYRMEGDSKIPVSKNAGKLWQSRKDQAMSKRKSREYDKSWDEALRYYRNDQISHRYGNGEDAEYAGNEVGATKMQRRFSETENIVFANTSALVPTLYAKNPHAAFTAVDQEDNADGVMLEKLVSRIMSKKSAPGINLKPKARKSVVMCTLTNAAYIEVGYTFKEQSSEQALSDLAQLSKQLEKAKSPNAIRDIEGKIEALEASVDLLRPSGPFAKFRRPHDVVVDPDSEEDDHSDAKWLMIGDWISTAYINAKFSMKKGQKQVSVYKPTHVMKKTASGGDGHNDLEREINNFSLFKDDEEKNKANEYGYDDEASFRKAQRTKCWWVWDKITRRVLLYADNDWSWPIWVWDDPYKLQQFFPLHKLQFYTDPEEPMGKGEVTYYLDQQDAINTMNSEMKQARQWARRNLFFDKNKVSADDVEKIIKGDEDVAVGVDVPEGMNLKDFVQSITPPSTNFIQLFDKEPILQAIDRVSSVQPVMRGTEFKTNTTNQAINQYNSTQQTRTDEKIDAVEDFIGNIAWSIAQMCMQFMSREEVGMLIGNNSAAEWKQRSANDIEREIQMTIVGGSTQKPSSEAKKQQALQMGQVLGQFVNAAPQPVLMVLLKTLRTAFGDVIPDEDWQVIMTALQGGGSAQPTNGATEGGGGAETAGPPPDAASSSGQQDPVAVLEQIVDSLPKEAKEALGAAMAQGVPVREALERIMQLVQSGGQQQQPQA